MGIDPDDLDDPANVAILAALSLNPLRYRGYVYDSETGFYYLQSRYYDPETCRFINADALLSAGEGLLDHNMFAYCGNDPVNYRDDGGNSRMPFEQLIWPGQIHRYVQLYLAVTLGGRIEVPITDVNGIMRRIDLVIGNQAYEIKPYSYNSPVRMAVALAQLAWYVGNSKGKYIIGQKMPGLNGVIYISGFRVQFEYVGMGLIFYSFRNIREEDVVHVEVFADELEEEHKQQKSKQKELVTVLVETTSVLAGAFALSGLSGAVGKCMAGGGGAGFALLTKGLYTNPYAKNGITW